MPDHADYLNVVHAMINEVQTYPEVRAWMSEQAVKIAATQSGTQQEQRDNDGNPVPKWPFGGPGECFEYIAYKGGMITGLRLRCVLTGNEIDLTPEDGW